MEFSRGLLRLYDIILRIASEGERELLKSLRDKTLIGQFVAGARGQSARFEMKRLQLADRPKFQPISGQGL